VLEAFGLVGTVPLPAVEDLDVEMHGHRIALVSQLLEEWRRVFLESGQQGLKRRGLDPEEREVRRLQAKIGDMTMRLELAEHLLEKRGFAEDVRRLRK